MLQAVLREYPHLDALMVKTIIAAYENGTLDKLIEESHDIEPLPFSPDELIIKKSITVDEQEILSTK